jgi:hypothetical protein
MAKNFVCPCSAFSPADPKIVSEDIFTKAKQFRGVPCRPSCQEKGRLRKQELSSLAALIGAMTLLLAVIALSHGVEVPDPREDCLRERCEATTAGLVSLDYLLMVPFLQMVALMLFIRVRGYLEKMRMAGGENIFRRKP